MWHYGMAVTSYLMFVLALGWQEPKAVFPSWPWWLRLNDIWSVCLYNFCGMWCGDHRNSLISFSSFIHPSFSCSSRLHLLPRQCDHRHRCCLSHCQEPGEASLALSSVQVTGRLPDGAYANKKPWVMASNFHCSRFSSLPSLFLCNSPNGW